MEDEAKIRPIKLNSSMDSSRISTKIHHTTFGLKIADRMATDPRTGKLLVGMMEDETTLQSKHHCFPLKFALEKEKKSTYEQFSDVFEELKKMSEEDNEELNGYKRANKIMKN
jgi:hypothetical protein